MKTVVICEKPNVANKVKAVVKEPNTRIVSAHGHIVELGFDGEDEKWTYPVITTLKDILLKPMSNSAQTLQDIIDVAREADVLVSATDLDREGSAIFLEIYLYMKEKFKDFDPELKRMHLSSLSKSEIKKAWSNLQDFDYGRSYAGFTRNYQDMQWGINLTRALTLASNSYFGVMSSGRVQTPMLKFLVERDMKIDKFEPKTYFNVKLKAEVVVEGKAELITLLYDGKITDVQKANTIKSAFKPGDKITLGVSDSENKIPPPPPFNGTSLQVNGSKITGISPKDIANRSNGVAQKLYESSLISYPGTDSEKYTDDWKEPDYAEFKKLLETATGETLSGRNIPITGRKSDPAHPCIRPISLWDDDTKTLSSREKQIYDLIARRCSAGFCEDGVDSVKRVKVDSKGHKFKTTGRAVKNEGWRTVYPYYKKQSNDIPNVSDGDIATVVNVISESKETKPPARFNDIALISLCEKHGLGTKNTRPSMIEKLVKRGYVDVVPKGKKNFLRTTAEGRNVIKVLDNYAVMVTGTELTEIFNGYMDGIETSPDWETIYQHANHDMIRQLVDIMDEFVHNERQICVDLTGQDPDEVVECPKCGHDMLLRRGKSGVRFFGCTAWPDCECSFFINDEETIRSSLKCGCGLFTVSGNVGKRDYLRCLNPDCDSSPLRCERCGKPLRVGRSRKTEKLYILCRKCDDFNSWTLNLDGVKKV